MGRIAVELGPPNIGTMRAVEGEQRLVIFRSFQASQGFPRLRVAGTVIAELNGQNAKVTIESDDTGETGYSGIDWEIPETRTPSDVVRDDRAARKLVKGGLRALLNSQKLA